MSAWDDEDDKPLSMASHYALQALREQLETQAELTLAALSAGARSPWHVEPPRSAPRPPRPQIFTESGAVVEGQTEEETEALGQDYSPAPAVLASNTTEAKVEAAVFREGEFVRHSRNRAGETRTIEATEKGDESRAVMNKQTEDTALALVSRGIKAFQEPTAPKLSIVCPRTGKRLDQLPVRRINLFPSVAAQRRAPMITHLEAFLEKYPQTQMVTFTRGPRLVVHEPEELREAVAVFHRRISRLVDNSHGWLCAQFGFELVFAGTEFGEVKPMADGGLSVHIHAHTFARFKRPLHSAQMTCFDRLMWVHWGAVWDRGEAINKAREACKYPIKPADQAALTDEHIELLYHAGLGIKFMRPMGELRETIRARKRGALRGRRWRVTKGKETSLALQFRPDWNAQPKEVVAAKKRQAHKLSTLPVYIWRRLIERALSAIADEIRKRRFALKAIVARRAEVLAGNLRQAPPTFETKRRKEAAKAKKKAKFLQAGLLLFFWFTSARDAAAARAARAAAAAIKRRKPMENQIIARAAAAYYFPGQRVSAPALIVANYNGNLAALTSHLFVAQGIAAVEAQVKAAEDNLANFDAQEKAARIRAAEIDAERALSEFRVLKSSHQSHNCRGQNSCKRAQKTTPELAQN